MGKTTLWRAAVERCASESGLLVLQAQPVESETTLSYTGIGDLLDPVLDEALEPLPAVQQRALSRALALGEDDGPALDPRALRVALMNALRRLADDRPVLIAIDDSQWLDYASSAGARVRSAPISQRARRPAALAPHRARERAARRAPALARGETLHASRRRRPRRLRPSAAPSRSSSARRSPRPLLVEVHEAAGGNPFYALEIVRMLQRTGTSIEAGQPVPLPDSLHDLVHGRLLALPTESRDFLLRCRRPRAPDDRDHGSGLGRRTRGRPDAGARRARRRARRRAHPLHASAARGRACTRRVDPLRRRRDPRAPCRAPRGSRGASVAAGRVASIEPDDERRGRARGGGGRTRAAWCSPRRRRSSSSGRRELTPADDEPAVRRRSVRGCLRTPCRGRHGSRSAAARAGARAHAAGARARRPARRVGALPLVRRRRARRLRALSSRLSSEAEPGSLVEAYAQEGLGGTFFRLRERLAEAVEVSGSAATTARTARRDPPRGGEPRDEGRFARRRSAAPRPSRSSQAALALQAACAERPVLRQPRVRRRSASGSGTTTSSAPTRRTRRWPRLRGSSATRARCPYTYVMLGQIDCARGRFDEALRTGGGRRDDRRAGGAARAGGVRPRGSRSGGGASRARRGSVSESGSARARAGAGDERCPGVDLRDLGARPSRPRAGRRARGALEFLRPAHRAPRARRHRGAGSAAVHARRDRGTRRAAGCRTRRPTLLDAYQAAAERLGRRRGIAAAHRRPWTARRRERRSRAMRSDELETAVELYALGDTPVRARPRAARARGGAAAAKRRREARATLEEALGGLRASSARRSGPSALAASSSASAGAPRHPARSRRPRSASPLSSPRARRTARSQPRCSSPTARSKGISPASSGSSASATAPRSPQRWRRSNTGDGIVKHRG